MNCRKNKEAYEIVKFNMRIYVFAGILIGILTIDILLTYSDCLGNYLFKIKSSKSKRTPTFQCHRRGGKEQIFL